jgi:hypothetical protein
MRTTTRPRALPRTAKRRKKTAKRRRTKKKTRIDLTHKASLRRVAEPEA